jgi:hypothetical protein
LIELPALRRAGWAAGLTLLLSISGFPGELDAQGVTVRVNGDALHIRAPAFDFMSGEVVRRLKDGRSVRLELDLTVLRSRPSGVAPPAAQVSQAFVLSYDLWEERFAVTHARTPPQSISHLAAADVETWCLDRLTVPVSALASLGRNPTFWIRIQYRVPAADDGTGQPRQDDDGFTLRGLIDRLSRRRTTADLHDALDAGPFRLP